MLKTIIRQLFKFKYSKDSKLASSDARKIGNILFLVYKYILSKNKKEVPNMIGTEGIFEFIKLVYGSDRKVIIQTIRIAKDNE